MPDNLEFPKASARSGQGFRPHVSDVHALQVDRTTSSASIGWRLGSLTSDSERTLSQFKDKLEHAGLYQRDAGQGKPSHDDATLVRFLRARKFEVQGAFDQFKDTEHWRRTKQLDQLYDEFPVKEFCDSQEVYTQWTGRRAKSGQPLYVYKIGSLTKERVAKYSADGSRLEPRMMVLLEAGFQKSVASGQDADGVMRASVMATAHYPETLGNLFIVGAPSFFSVIWGWIKNWFDAHTVSKLTIVPANQVLSTLEKVVALENIPVAYGGKLDWKFGDEPMLDDEMQSHLGFERLPRGPIRFSEQQGVKLVGSGRSDSEIQEFSEPKRKTSVDQEKQEEADDEQRRPEDGKLEKQASEQESTSASVPNIIVNSPNPEDSPSIQVETSQRPSDSTLPNGTADEHQHTIEDAKRENISAPVKALAAELEGTTL
ncbi:cytosolic factor, phosphatidylinositol/phosphatidylcholine transfer protein [Microbotryomycetes sp. JL201]|nr:cytosolic factor, phosphatidylinositol/phosphatidylcholine transfer protein [Microbotryomycetes sp. JL201]